ncbi:phage terminase large subunit family protein [Magnetospirillum molischianum]|uniref:Terminase large subunit gp17-like C-terminal domain-containing protein n=1 Tax=Magnetospirillum molischianum DSM 120 TaxID=1150626 RepID=H8FY43_MAGML|nr:terminase family protein [Magnetospirillum molischianum]CCG43281.1 conserved hypothetical protein [Magnetospirillum molischianum DSM 120]
MTIRAELDSSTSLTDRPTLRLHRGQVEVLLHDARFKVVVAGRRWGKTQCAKTAIIKAAKIKKRKIWYVAPTYRMAKQIMWTELLEAIPRKWIKKLNETSLDITLRNGTMISLRGADKPDTLRGVGLHYLVLDEFQDMREDVWKKVLRPTLASTGGHALIIGTPKAFNLLYELYMLGQRGDTFVNKKGKRVKNHWKSWQFPTITSPFIPKSEIEAARADMDERSFRQEFLASFEAMSGRVYYAFDRSIHLVDLELNPQLPIWVGMDFNIDPMSAIIMQPQDDGTVHVLDEIILYGSNTHETAEELERRFWRQVGQRQVTIYPDPAGGTGSTKSHGKSDFDILREKGFVRLKYRLKHPKVADRVNAVNRMLMSADGRVRMKIDRRCKALIEALEQVIYKPGTREVDKTMSLEHPADALGYAIEKEFPVRKLKVIGASI